MTTTKPLTRAELDAIRERCEAATPGPWTPVPQTSDGRHIREAAVVNASMQSFWQCCYKQGNGQPEQDAAFIAAARTDVPALLAHIEALETALREWRSLCESGALVTREGTIPEWPERVARETTALLGDSEPGEVAPEHVPVDR